jgi:hypothetical protein
VKALGVKAHPAASELAATEKPLMEDDLQTEQAAAALACDFVHHLLPCALGLQLQVDDGEPLGEDDVRFLEDMLGQLESAVVLLDRHPRVEALWRCASGLYDDIMTAAFLNQRAVSELAGRSIQTR